MVVRIFRSRVLLELENWQRNPIFIHLGGVV